LHNNAKKRHLKMQIARAMSILTCAGQTHHRSIAFIKTKNSHSYVRFCHNSVILMQSLIIL
jgi:hypothetical protein